jgi:hypothetical protein
MTDKCFADLISDWGGDIKKIYSASICQAALRGVKLPTTDIDAMAQVTRLCVLGGIRHHNGFGTELRSAVRYPEFIRTINARAIMSNEIPHMTTPDEIPYCVWYPDVASEDTYRELVKRYPQMRYQVGRACAVAGYNDLYMELDLLPDISIAEEARDAVMRSKQIGKDGAGSQDIFQHITGQHLRWQVMNDYTRSVELDKPVPARYGLNGDTAVVSLLGLRRGYDVLRPQSRFRCNNTRLEPPYMIDDELAPCYFNITEDWNVDEYTSRDMSQAEYGTQATKRLQTEEMLELLWNPLPVDLPCGDKDILILMAAYYGDVDRYARLRRPLSVSLTESYCITRGIYHSTVFAKWWSLQPEAGRPEAAINARFIMSNDISRITDETEPHNLPQQIWYPHRAHAETYLELARRIPFMKAAVARALIVADYQEAWDSLDDIEPYLELMVEAEASPNRHYLESLKQRCLERGLEPSALERRYCEDLCQPVSRLVERSSLELVVQPRLDSIPWDSAGPNIYDGVGVDVSEVELFIVAPKELRPPKGLDQVDLGQLYFERRNQPPSEGQESEAYQRRGELPRRGRGGRGTGILWGNGRRR